MEINKKSPFLILLAVYFIVALTGFWFLTKGWLPQGFILAGHDSGLALDSKQFLISRLFAWDERLNFGQDNSFNFGSLTLHSIDYFLAFVSGSQVAGNQITIFFWLAVIFSSALAFALSLRGHLGRFFVFLFPIFITFNFYVFQSVFMLERAKYGLLAATLLFLALAFKVLERKIPIVFAVLLSSIVFFIFNGGSLWGFPLYGGLIITIGVLLFCALVWGWRERNFSNLRRLLIFLGLVAVGFVLINAYAIFPYLVKFQAGGFSGPFDRALIAPNRSWLDYISQASSFLNLFRLQGVPDWYNGSFTIDPSHPYASQYATKFPFIFASFLFPLFGFLAFFLAKTRGQKKLISFSALTLLVSFVFVSGSHAPLGFLYAFLYEKLPGFAIFRTPFYKFGSALFLGAAVLMGFTFSQLIERVVGRIKGFYTPWAAGFLLSSAVLFLWLVYHQALLSPNVLSWRQGLTTKTQVPQYVWDFKSWIEREDIKGRMLLLPPLDEGWRIDGYQWGYWSLSSLPSMLVSRAAVGNDGGLTSVERSWVWELYSQIEEGQETRVMDLTKRLGIELFLVRKDILSDSSLFVLKSPAKFEKALDSFTNVKRVITFGDWIVYKTTLWEDKKIYPSASLVALPQNNLFLYRDFAPQENIFVTTKDRRGLPNELLSKDVESIGCSSCAMENVDLSTTLPDAKILPNSPFYVFKKFRDTLIFKTATTDQEQISAYLGSALRRAGEVKYMLDFRVREKYLVQTLKTIDDYLVTAHQLLESSSAPQTDFLQAKRAFEVLRPIEVNFRIEIDKARTGTFGASVIRGMTDVLWQIHRIKEFYGPILEDKDKWTREKWYKVELPEQNLDGVFITTHSLPTDNAGNRIYPDKALLITHDTEVPVGISPQSEGLIRLDIPTGANGEVILSLGFPNLPNKFVLRGTGIEEARNGPVACVYGDIERFDDTRSFNVKVTSTRTNQPLQLYIKGAKERSFGSNYFLHGDEEVRVFPLVSYEPFSYFYTPTGQVKYSTIYLCSENKETPAVAQIVADEIFSPTVVLVRNKDGKSQSQLPQISYHKENPTRYRVDVSGASDPFILVFNERYDPLWEIKEAETESVGSHFPVDGYSNGWEIKKTGNLRFLIVYGGQKPFYLGGAATAAALVMVLTGIALFARRRNKHD